MSLVNQRYRLNVAIPIIALLALLTACDKQPLPSPAKPETTVAAWATVNGSALTDPELDYALNRFFGDQFVDARVMLKIRDSLIASRALAQQAEATLDATVMAELDLAVRAYREERLIAAYIENTSVPEPVSAQMVADYYQSHLEDFGAATIKRLEVLEANVDLAKLPLSDVSKALFDLSRAEEWSQLTLPTYMRTYSVASNGQLPSSLKTALPALAVGSMSSLVIDATKIYIFKVVAQESIAAKPMDEVSVDIRKRLAATMLSKTVKTLTGQVVGSSEIIKNY